MAAFRRGRVGPEVSPAAADEAARVAGRRELRQRRRLHAPRGWSPHRRCRQPGALGHGQPGGGRGPAASPQQQGQQSEHAGGCPADAPIRRLRSPHGDAWGGARVVAARIVGQAPRTSVGARRARRRAQGQATALDGQLGLRATSGQAVRERTKINRPAHRHQALDLVGPLARRHLHRVRRDQCALHDAQTGTTDGERRRWPPLRGQQQHDGLLAGGFRELGDGNRLTRVGAERQLVLRQITNRRRVRRDGCRQAR